MWIDKDGLHHQLSRKWYSKRETLEIYANGGHIVLHLKEPTAREKAKLARQAFDTRQSKSGADLT